MAGDSEFIDAWRSINGGGGTRTNKQLPAARQAPSIPARIGSAGRIATPASTGGGTDMTLAGSKIYNSTDGLITLGFPNSVQVVVGGKTLTIPAIVSTP